MKIYTIISKNSGRNYATRVDSIPQFKLNDLMFQYCNAPEASETRMALAYELAGIMSREATIERHERGMKLVRNFIMGQIPIGATFAAREIKDEIHETVSDKTIRVALAKMIEEGILEDHGVKIVQAKHDWGSTRARVLTRLK